MRRFGLLVCLLAGLTPASTAFAQTTLPRVEVGTALAGMTTVFGEDDSATVFGIPPVASGAGVYASIFIGSRMAIEPQLFVLVSSSDFGSQHAVKFNTQFDYFLGSSAESAPYLFAGLGAMSSSDSDASSTIGVGAGYRFRLGSRLTMRIDARVALDDDNQFDLALSLGGLFGTR